MSSSRRSCPAIGHPLTASRCQDSTRERAEITPDRNGDEILPIEYDDNYVTVFPGRNSRDSRCRAATGQNTRMGQTRGVQHSADHGGHKVKPKC